MATKRKKRKAETVTLWVTRDDFPCSCYEVWRTKPRWLVHDGWWLSSELLTTLCPDLVHSVLPHWKMQGGPKSIFELEMS